MKKTLFILLFFPLIIFSQNKLKNIKKNINTSSKKTKGDYKIEEEKEEDSVGEILATSVATTITSPFISLFTQIVFYSTIGIIFGELKVRDLNKYPYSEHGEYTKIITPYGKRQNLKLGANYLPNRISGLEINAIFKPIPILGIDGSYIHFLEKNLRTTESFDKFSMIVNYYRIREKHVSLWWGLGATYVGNEVDKFGFTYQLGTEIYPIKPVSLHLSFKQSFINNSNLNTFKVQGKYHWNNKAFFLGYHFFNLAYEKILTPSFGFEIYF